MKRLDRFILKAFIGPFVAILLVVMFILVMQFLWVYIDELVGKGLGFGVICEFLMWGACTILPTALPLATLLSAMWTLGQMAEHNELIATKCAGVPLARILSPLFAASILICVFAFYASNKIVPVAYNNILTLREDINQTKDEIKIPCGIFYDGIEGYILRVDSRDDRTDMMHGVMVYDHTGGKGNTNITLADSARIKMSEEKEYLTFTMYNGTNYQETNTRQYRDTTLELQRIQFSRQELIIPLEHYSFEKSDTTRFNDQIKSMALQDLTEFQDSMHVRFNKEHADQVALFTGSNNFYKQRQLDTSFRARGLRDFEDEEFLKWGNLSSKENAYVLAQEKAGAMETNLRSLNRDIYEYQFYIRRSDHEIAHRFIQALACLLLFLIGAPLGSFVRKGGLGIAAIISTLFFLLYWVVDMVGTKLAKDGAIDPIDGALIPVYVLLPIGLLFLWQASHDSSFSTDQIKSAWRKVKAKFIGIFRKTRIVYMGTPEFAVAPLDTLISKGYKVVGVVTVADKPSGRGLKVNESAVKKYAVEKGIPVLQPVKLKDPEFLSALKAWKADLFVVVAFRMLPKEVWAMPKMGTFNLHAALLPQYRGAAPINWAVINGERRTGVTTFMLDENIDTGGIIYREECLISRDDTAGDVHDKLMELGANLVAQTVESLIQGNAEMRVQGSFIQGTEVLKPAPKLTRELCHIDWRDTATNICNLIRGLSPYPTAFTEIVPAGGTPTQLKIFKAEKMAVEDVCPDGILPAPGTVLSDGKTYLAVAASDGIVSIKELQLSGKKRMEAGAFLLGFRDPCSYVCTPGTSMSEISKTRG